jgi:glycerophosphoryl diester phosphodiesterase
MKRDDGVLVSAHRCLTRAAVERALGLGVEFVEFDVQRCGDGTFVLLHDAVVEVDGDDVPLSDLTFDGLYAIRPDVLLFHEVLGLLAESGTRAHLDLKFVSPDPAYELTSTTYEVAATALAVQHLGAENLVVTTLDDRSVRAIRDWADVLGHGLLVGLSLGRGVTGFPVWRQLKVRASEVWPHVRYHHSRANVVVAHHWLARLGVARFARRRRLPLLVWTVNTEDSLRHWLRPGRAWLVTTNEPELALRVRSAERLRP